MLALNMALLYPVVRINARSLLKAPPNVGGTATNLARYPCRQVNFSLNLQRPARFCLPGRSDLGAAIPVGIGGTDALLIALMGQE
jgi:hypothetical protein